MPFLRQILFASCLLLCPVVPAGAQPQLTDSLRQVLARTADPARRVQLLLDLKDVNEDTNLNLPYSIRLFREAAAIRDTYALSIAIVRIINNYAPYPEKEDSLLYYVHTLRVLTPGTPEEGMDCFAEMAIAFNRLRATDTRTERVEIARRTIAWCDSFDGQSENCYRRTGLLILHGYADKFIRQYERNKPATEAAQIAGWKKAYLLTHGMPGITVRKYFANIIYALLSDAYSQTNRYSDLEKLATDYIAIVEAYIDAEKRSGRRPCLYADNVYVRPYQQLVLGAQKAGHYKLADSYFRYFRTRMLRATGENLDRNRTYLYELGYLWKDMAGDYAESIRYNDSLVYLIEHDKGYYRAAPDKIFQTYRDRGRMLTEAGRYDEAFDTYAHTARLQDSIFGIQRADRSETIRLRHEMDRRKLSETRAVIRNRITVQTLFIVLGLLLLGTGIYLYRARKRNIRLQKDILRHSLKAEESERMKSIFTNTICRGIGPPHNAIDRAVQTLMTADKELPERQQLLETIRTNIEILLSTLDNMLEAANLDSLTGSLQPEPTDVDEVCRAEVLSASRLRHNDAVEYRIETPGKSCTVSTHPKYFGFVIRALLDNAGKFTCKGNVTLRYEADAENNELRIRVTDTGCGIPTERRSSIFQTQDEHGDASHGLSLRLCSLIARRLSGTIRLDEAYSPGACFIFTIPLRP